MGPRRRSTDYSGDVWPRLRPALLVLLVGVPLTAVLWRAGVGCRAIGTRTLQRKEKLDEASAESHALLQATSSAGGDRDTLLRQCSDGLAAAIRRRDSVAAEQWYRQARTGGVQSGRLELDFAGLCLEVGRYERAHTLLTGLQYREGSTAEASGMLVTLEPLLAEARRQTQAGLRRSLGPDTQLLLTDVALDLPRSGPAPADAAATMLSVSMRVENRGGEPIMPHRHAVSVQWGRDADAVPLVPVPGDRARSVAPGRNTTMRLSGALPQSALARELPGRCLLYWRGAGAAAHFSLRDTVAALLTVTRRDSTGVGLVDTVTVAGRLNGLNCAALCELLSEPPVSRRVLLAVPDLRSCDSVSLQQLAERLKALAAVGVQVAAADPEGRLRAAWAAPGTDPQALGAYPLRAVPVFPSEEAAIAHLCARGLPGADQPPLGSAR